MLSGDNKMNIMTTESDESLLTPALSGIVIGYWSQEGKPPNKLGESHHNVFTQAGDNSCALKQELINTFTHDGQTVIDATGSGKQKLGIICPILRSRVQFVHS